jgi:signal recognition particle receptor subunit alpha
MLDHCSIFHKGNDKFLPDLLRLTKCVCSGGIVLWSRSFTPTAESITHTSSSPVNSLVREALIEGRTTDNHYEKDGYAIKWTFVNDLELIFVVRLYRHLLFLHRSN